MDSDNVFVICASAVVALLILAITFGVVMTEDMAQCTRACEKSGVARFSYVQVIENSAYLRPVCECD